MNAGVKPAEAPPRGPARTPQGPGRTPGRPQGERKNFWDAFLGRFASSHFQGERDPAAGPLWDAWDESFGTVFRSSIIPFSDKNIGTVQWDELEFVPNESHISY